MELRECTNREEWNTAIQAHGGHPLQLWGWGELKAAHGWSAQRLFVVKADETVAALQVLRKPLPFPFRAFYYVPRGPVVWGIDKGDFSREIVGLLRQRFTGVSVLFEPDEEQDLYSGWRKTSERVLLADTLVLDLTKSEDELLADMTKKTRQYIRKSEKDGVEVRRLTTEVEIADALAIYQQTATRANFALHDEAYYTDMIKLCSDDVVVYGAFYEGKMVSFLWNIESQSTVFELYGGVTDDGMRVRANFTLKWHALRDAKGRGVARYDVNGLLNEGVSNFKQGFASHQTKLVGAYELTLSSLAVVWRTMLPFAKSVIRRAKRLARR